MNNFDDSKLYGLLNEDDFSKVDTFLNHNGLDSIDRDGRTLLMSAIIENKYVLSKYLLEMGCDLNIKDKQGLTALHLAAMNSDHITESIKLLLATGANPSKANKHGVAPEDLL